MLLALAFLLALAWAYLRGGRLSRLSDLALNSYGVALAAFAVQLLVIYLPALDRQIVAALLALSYGVLAWFVWRNRHLPGMWLIGAGLLANWLVMLANGGFMPVTYEALDAAGKSSLVTETTAGTRVFGSKDILLPAGDTRLWILSDIFIVPPPFPVSAVFSVGDLLMALGMFRLVEFGMGARGDTGAARQNLTGVE
jgi:hypothetical protein